MHPPISHLPPSHILNMAGIIILDDNQEFCDVADVLVSQGKKVVVIARASDAIDQNYLIQPDVLIASTRRNDGYDGVEICQAFRHGNPEVRIIMIGEDSETLPKEICCYVPSPCTTEQVLAAVLQHC